MARKFYGGETAKGFNKKAFFENVLAHLSGDHVGEDMIDLLMAACEYELEGISLAKEKNGDKEKTPTLEKQIAKDIIAALVPLLKKAEPQTTGELIDLATSKGLVTSKGTNFSNPWVNTIFKALADAGKIQKVQKISSVTREKDGMKLVSQEPKIAYQLV